jgi:hypothetical protein
VLSGSFPQALLIALTQSSLREKLLRAYRVKFRVVHAAKINNVFGVIAPTSSTRFDVMAVAPLSATANRALLEGKGALIVILRFSSHLGAPWCQLGALRDKSPDTYSLLWVSV